LSLAKCPLSQAYGAYRSAGLCLAIGPFNLHVAGNLPATAFLDTLRRLYGEHRLVSTKTTIVDFHIRLRRPLGLRTFLRPQVSFESDAEAPFHRFPLDHAFPMFEWGLNWAIAVQAHQYLMLHSAVVAKDDRAMILPAQPGSGKSTLCAALVHRGWRLLSDEFGLIRPGGLEVTPIPRPIPLKNNSIELIRDFAPDAVFGPEFPKTRKGRISHVKPPASALGEHERPARITWVVFPQYRAGAKPELHPFPKGRAFLKVAGNAFNYKLQGEDGFRTVADIINHVDPQYFEFDDLEAAVKALDELAERTPRDS
jgi:HprK-related kinase A